MRNIELLTRVRDLVKNEPKKLDMDHWAEVAKDAVDFGDGQSAKVSCGTTACVAGWAVQLAGDKLLVNKGGPCGDRGYLVTSSVAKNGRVCLDIEDRARKLLGLTHDESGILFYAQDDEVIPCLDTLIAGGHIDYNDDDLDDRDFGYNPPF